MQGKTVWITGAGGLIGNYLVRSAPRYAEGWRAIPLTHADLELTDFGATARRFSRELPAAIIHCAALSRSPECQENPRRAELINVEAAAHLHRLAAEIPFLFFSTDLVFDGTAGNYAESAQPNPLSVYADTKARAEAIVLENPRHTVIRTSLNAGLSPSGNRGFNEEWRRAWKEGKTLRLFHDEYRSPIHAAVTAKAVWGLLQAGGTGIFHLGGTERMSRYQMGVLLAQRCPELNPRLESASRLEYRGAPRPADTTLECTRIQTLLSWQLPGLSDWVNGNPHEFF